MIGHPSDFCKQKMNNALLRVGFKDKSFSAPAIIGMDVSTLLAEARSIVRSEAARPVHGLPRDENPPVF